MKAAGILDFATDLRNPDFRKDRGGERDFWVCEPKLQTR